MWSEVALGAAQVVYWSRIAAHPSRLPQMKLGPLPQMQLVFGAD